MPYEQFEGVVEAIRDFECVLIETGFYRASKVHEGWGWT